MRIDNWPIVLADFISARSNTPFAWGSHDCCLFAADAVLAITGTDYAAPYRGQYDSEFGAGRIIVEAGGLRAMVGAQMSEIDPKLAQRGDIVLIEQDGAAALAICVGVNLIAAGPNGLIQLPMSQALIAWRAE